MPGETVVWIVDCVSADGRSMMTLRKFCSLAAMFLLAGCVSAADQAVLDAMPTSRADLAQVPGLIREPMPVTVTLPDGTTAQLDGNVVRPDRPGQFPLVLISHGTSSEWTDRKDESSTEYTAEAIAFARRGWAVMTVVRAGFGRSGGTFLEDVGSCNNRDFVNAGRRMGDEVLAILQAVQGRNLPWADNTRVLLVGQSGGGLAALAAAHTQPASVVGVINFAGGNGAPIRGDYFCQPQRLIKAMAVFGLGTHIPSLWIYAANDSKFPPRLARAMFDDYTMAGAPATLISAPAYGDEGHYFIEAVDQWQPMVDKFLLAQHLPAKLVDEGDATNLAPPAVLEDSEGQAFFAKYLKLSEYEKAYAVGNHGGAGYADGYRTTAAAKMMALELCQRRDSGCRIYAVGNQPAL
jgi:dienelactone hydrolase